MTGEPNEYLNIKHSGGNWCSYCRFDDKSGVRMSKAYQKSFDYNGVVPDRSTLYTPARIVRFNDSVLAYVNCILASQRQAHQVGAFLESRQELLVLVNGVSGKKKQSLQESINIFWRHIEQDT